MLKLYTAEIIDSLMADYRFGNPFAVAEFEVENEDGEVTARCIIKATIFHDYCEIDGNQVYIDIAEEFGNIDYSDYDEIEIAEALEYQVRDIVESCFEPEPSRY